MGAAVRVFLYAVDMLPCVMPSTGASTWYWGGDCTLYEEAPYGNEWIINKYFFMVIHCFIWSEL